MRFASGGRDAVYSFKLTFVVKKKKFEFLHCEVFSVLWRLPENSNGINSFKTVCLLN